MTRRVGERGPGQGPRRGSALDRADARNPRYPIEDGRHVSAKRAVVLLKARGLPTRQVATIVGVTERSINRWLEAGLADEVARVQDESTQEARRYLHSKSLRLARQLVKIALKGKKEDGPAVKACEIGLGIVGITKKTIIEHQHTDPLEEASDEELEAQARAELEPQIRAQVEAELVDKGWRRPEVVKRL